MRGRFIMVDGLDGSGKGTIIDAMRHWAEENRMITLDLRDFCKEHDRLPNNVEISQCDAIISAEPTFCLVGKAIRNELVRHGAREYSAMSIAQAFALDREILYKQVIIPALKLGKHVFQERGVISSVVYQPAHDRIQLSELMHLAGNRLAIENAPDIIIIAKVNPETVMKRLHLRKKKDDSIFESLSFQRKLEQRYMSDWLRELFERHGSKIVYFDTNDPKTAEETAAEAKEFLTSLFH